jgi:hypothetical protein
LGDKWEVLNFGISARTLMSKGDLPYINEPVYRQALAFNPNAEGAEIMATIIFQKLTGKEQHVQ